MKKIIRFSCLAFIFLNSALITSAQAPIKIALLKYRGGGDWYSVVDACQNLIKFTNKELNTNFSPDYATIEVGSAEIFNYPFLFLTGHGNVVFSDDEVENLRNYLLAGGFLYVDDDFGMDPYIRPALKKLLPDAQLQELPFEHPIFHQRFNFSKGVVKVHDHNSKPPQTYGIFHQNRLVCLYTFESNISDGWESRDVHKDNEEVRTQSLRMGANILQYVFGGG
jgi:hypothetical protein